MAHNIHVELYFHYYYFILFLIPQNPVFLCLYTR